MPKSSAKAERPMTPADARVKLEEMLPDAIEALRLLGGRNMPPRHATLKLAFAREILDRVGVPKVAASTISNPAGGPVEVVLTIVKPKKDDDEDK